MMADADTPDPRRAAFRELIEAQDAGAGVRESRDRVAAKYGLTADEVLAVERDGIDGQWEPLGQS